MSRPTTPPKDRSPWAAPIVIIGAGVLIVVAAALAALLLFDDDTAPPPSSASSTASTSRTIVTSTVTDIATSTATVTTGRTVPTVPGTDWQGFPDGPRCNGSDDPAVMIGETARSRIVICQVGAQTGRLYYKGSADSRSVEIDHPRRTGDTFRVTNDGVTYVISPDALVISHGHETVADEPMLAHWLR
ncbi:hypothetical protein GTV32_07645 [Gordonia sp. SID5947]|uniref:hypothetical protein n=1 Tax=Gordonia sp. SID5947 TaxID=2690315 RepID=UPI0013706E0F|nr:hypothetical protein [Gordonia sp. SID5947]MYR06194.1 hypothetical protein [Gordonia sp. SID5947]